MATLFAVTVDTEEEWDWSAGFPAGVPTFVRRIWLNFEDAVGESMLSWPDMLRSTNLACICFTLHSSSLQHTSL